MNRLRYHLPGGLQGAVDAALAAWDDGGNTERLWRRDASLWTGTDEPKWLGWRTLATDQQTQIDRFREIAADVQQAGFRDILLIGMGGSSLFPEVLAETFGRIAGFPKLAILDSTDPAQIRTAESGIDLARTLFVVSSKSGTTLEPNVFFKYFYHRVLETVGESEAGSRFAAVTDPGSALERTAAEKKFRAVYHGIPSVGGRYSALSLFGMAPAAAMGLDVAKFLEESAKMSEACSAGHPAGDNPGVLLGVMLGAAANSGRDKLTLIASSGIASLGAWLEQLIAESTGKDGRAIIPVDREPLAAAELYGTGRIFVYLRLAGAPDPRQDAAADSLITAGFPVLRIDVEDIYSLGQEVFRWEIATAVAGSLMGINPFNQPDVEASKIATRALTDAFEQSGELPSEQAFFEADGIRLFTDAANAEALTAAAAGDRSLAGYLGALLNPDGKEYLAILAYIEMNRENEQPLQEIRRLVLNRGKLATCLGFGPRFLHSTGQAYKGGPNTGIFLQITCDDAADLPVPGQSYTFGIVKAAQARGDFEVLVERKRRALRAHLGVDVKRGLEALLTAAKQSIG